MRMLLLCILFASYPLICRADTIPLSKPEWSTVPVSKAEWGTTVTRVSSSYPVHGVQWHIVGSAETKQELIDHLMSHSNHSDVRAIYSRSDLQAMSREQLLTLHDDSHRHVVVNVSRPRTQTYYSSDCPNGNCPQAQSRVRIRNSNRTFLGLNLF